MNSKKFEDMSDVEFGYLTYDEADKIGTGCRIQQKVKFKKFKITLISLEELTLLKGQIYRTKQNYPMIIRKKLETKLKLNSHKLFYLMIKIRV